MDRKNLRIWMEVKSSYLYRCMAIENAARHATWPQTRMFIKYNARCDVDKRHVLDKPIIGKLAHGFARFADLPSPTLEGESRAFELIWTDICWREYRSKADHHLHCATERTTNRGYVRWWESIGVWKGLTSLFPPLVCFVPRRTNESAGDEMSSNTFISRPNGVRTPLDGSDAKNWKSSYCLYSELEAAPIAVCTSQFTRLEGTLS